MVSRDARTRDRERYLNTLSAREGLPVSDLIGSPGSSEWLWLLNGGTMETRERSGVLLPENLPGKPVQIVELLGKPYALLQYSSSQKASAALETSLQSKNNGPILAPAASFPVQNILTSLFHPSHPTPSISPTNPTHQTFPNALLLIPSFITPLEESTLLAAVKNSTSWTGPLKRRALHFGPHFDYTTFCPSRSASTPPPDYLTALLPRLPFQGEEEVPDQFTIQHYPPGAGIPPHVDTHSAFEEVLYSLSFGGGVRMQFRRCGRREERRMRLPKRSLEVKDTTPANGDRQSENGNGNGSGKERVDGKSEKSGRKEGETKKVEERDIEGGGAEEDDEEEETEEFEILLPPRSLLVMKGPSRYGWTHGIKGRKYDQEGTKVVARGDRYSVTMRKVKREEDVGCECEFPGVCDWRIREERERAQQNGSL